MTERRFVGKKRKTGSNQSHTLPESVYPIHTTHPTINLQRLIGNKATVRLLQRVPDRDGTVAPTNESNIETPIANKGETTATPANASQNDSPKTNTSQHVAAPDPAAKLLNGQQVSMAMNYYAADPQKYTPNLIANIQTEVGTQATGVMDEATIQAVARHQEAHPPLKVDGMAGPRTLPAVFRQGLDTDESQKKFAELGALVTKAQWIEQESAYFRLQLLADRANSALGDIGVPPLGHRIHNFPNRPDIGFDPELWHLIGSHKRMNDGWIEQYQINHLIQLTYRECRRVEQHFSIARMLAGRGMDAPAIATHMGIPQAIAKAAKDIPLQRDTPAFAVADGWYQTLYGKGAAENHATLVEYYQARDAFDVAFNESENNPTHENYLKVLAAYHRLEKAKEAKGNLPDQQDADRVEKDFEAAQKKFGPQV